MSEDSSQMGLGEVVREEKSEKEQDVSLARVSQIEMDVPEEWRNVSLGEIGELDTSGVNKKSNSDERTVQLVNYMDVYNNYEIDSSIEYMRVTAPESQIERSQVLPGDILFTPSSEEPRDIGNSSVVTECMANTLHSYHTVRLRPTSDEIQLDTSFSAWLANAPYVSKQFARRATGSTRYILTLGDFSDTRVLVPPPEEQREIATVLYTVDQMIQKTEKVINQVESSLAGITNEILTNGYGENELEQNRIYSFGFQMPTDWEVVELQTLNKDSKPICYGIVQPGEYHEEGIPILNIEHSRYGDSIDVDELHRVSTQLHEKYSRSKLTGGEVVISVKGSTGDVSRVPSNIREWNISRDLARISLKDGVNRDWLRFYLSTELAQKFIHVNSPGSTRDSLNIGDLKRLPILLPPQDEQDQIADVVAQVEHKLESENQYLHQLRRLKQGLMQDLLSGTVRTHETDIDIPEAMLVHD